ncbi:MAG: endonuclease [Acholeplasma sp.]
MSPVHLSVGDNWILPVATVMDNVDGELQNINIDTSLINNFYTGSNKAYEFTQEGQYEIIWTASDEAGNIGELILVIYVNVEQSNTYSGYYQTLDGLSDEQLSSTLYTLLNDTGQYETTTYGQARDYLEETDVWTGFNTDYLYLIYTDTLKGSVSEGYPDEGYALPVWDSGATWNREHVWAKSLFGTGSYNPGDSTRGIESDLHNLRAADTNVNSTRSNNIFTSQIYNAAGFGNYESEWYPGDDHRGDVARIIFYMDIRWGNDTDISNIGYLQTFIDWHLADPVDDFEIHRNNIIYGYQNNRNPFIDHPELVGRIYQ